jgi:hypothetical protein
MEGIKILQYTMTIKFKVVKYEKTCYDNQHIFIPFTSDTFDFWLSIKKNCKPFEKSSKSHA